MQEVANSFIDSTVQCWTCPIFDKLFVIISNAAAAAYQRFTLFSLVIFCILFAFFVMNAVWDGIKNNTDDPFLQKSVKPVIIKALIALALLGMGLTFPKLISKVTFEPVAEVTLQTSKILLPSDYEVSSNYVPVKIEQEGFFNTNLRDTVLQLIETSITSFQVFIKIGIGIIDNSFSLSSLLSIGSLFKHIIIFFIGLFLTYKFTRLFIKYSFCFMDIILAMALFAFFFPISLVLFIFKDAQKLPEWMKSLGGNLGAGQIKTLINAIVSVISSIITYTIVILIIRGYLDKNGVDIGSIQASTSSLFEFDLDNSDAMQITFTGAIVLVYVINYIADQIPKVTDKILSVFGISQENKLSNEMGDNTLAMIDIVTQEAKKIRDIVKNPKEAASEKKSDTASDTKPKSDKEDKK